jgi:hypothetical protein
VNKLTTKTISVITAGIVLTLSIMVLFCPLQNNASATEYGTDRVGHCHGDTTSTHVPTERDVTACVDFHSVLANLFSNVVLFDTAIIILLFFVFYKLPFYFSGFFVSAFSSVILHFRRYRYIYLTTIRLFLESKIRMWNTFVRSGFDAFWV